MYECLSQRKGMRDEGATASAPPVGDQCKPGGEDADADHEECEQVVHR